MHEPHVPETKVPNLWSTKLGEATNLNFSAERNMVDSFLRDYSGVEGEDRG